MFKTKIKKWIARAFVAVLTITILNLGFTSLVAFAASEDETACSAKGFTFQAGANPLICEKTAADPAKEECPSAAFSKKIEATKVICTKLPILPEDVDDLTKRISFLQSIQKFMNRLIWPILVLIGGLMDNSLLFGNGMEERLRDIWIPIRNLVNILFVIALVGIALYNVLGIGDENSTYSLKAILPKLIIGIIAVNFSFLGIKVVLDAVNVLTVSIFSLPDQVSDGTGQIIDKTSQGGKNMIAAMCEKQETDNPKGAITVDEVNKLGGGQAVSEFAIYHSLAVSEKYKGKIENYTSKMKVADILNGIKDEKVKTDFQADVKAYQNRNICENGTLTPAGEAYLSRWGSRNAAFAIALSMGKIVFYDNINFEGLKSFEKLAVNALFSVVMYFVYVASFVALFLILLARVLVMWICVAMSPILMLMIAVPEIKEKFGGLGKLADSFTKHLMAPLIIAISLTVGWIMLKAIQNLNNFAQNTAFQVNTAGGIPVMGLETLQDFIVAIGTIGVVWLGVFGAAEGTLVQGIVDGFGNFVKDAGQWIGSIPFKHLPIVPIKLGAGEATPATLSQVFTAAKQSFRDINDKDNDLYRRVSGKEPVTENTILDPSRVNDHKTVAKWINSLDDDKLKSDRVKEHLRKYAAGDPGYKHIEAANAELQRAIKAFEGGGAVEDFRKEVSRITSVSQSEKLTEKAAPGTKPPPAGPKPPADIDKGTKIGGTPLETIQPNETKRNADIGNFNTLTKQIVAAKDKGEAQKHLNKLRLTRQDGQAIAPTTAELKTILGEENFKELVKTMGGEQAITDALKVGPQGNGGAPPPVAPPIPPPATPPPANP